MIHKGKGTELFFDILKVMEATPYSSRQLPYFQASN
jgi:hypothetical protein